MRRIGRAIGFLALNAGALPLDDVRELVREESIAFLRSGCELPRTKVNVAPGREGPRAKLCRRGGRVCARMNAHVS